MKTKRNETDGQKDIQRRDGWDLVHIGGASGPGEGIPGAAKAKKTYIVMQECIL